MKKSTFILGLLTATLLSSCGVSRYSDNCEFKKTYTAIGVLATEDREVSDFSAIDFKGITRADIRIGNEYSLKIEADKNLVQHVDGYVANGTLIVGLDCSTDADFINVKITLPNLEAIRNMGSGEIKVLDNIDCNDFEISQLGSGNIYANGTFGNANFTISGSGNIMVNGSARNLSGRITGSGAIICKDLNAADANVHITGSGRAEVRAEKTLGINITGSGHVFYFGNPELSQSITGSGSAMMAGE